MLDFSIEEFKLSHGFLSTNGLLIGHIGSFIFNFLCGLFDYVWYHGLFISCLLWCKCWTLIFFVISICTELFLFFGGNWKNM